VYRGGVIRILAQLSELRSPNMEGAPPAPRYLRGIEAPKYLMKWGPTKSSEVC
jgi:hypothetical protein